MTPDQLASVNAEHSHQRALFAWANIAERFGFALAWDERTYERGALAILIDQTENPRNGLGYIDASTPLIAPVPELKWLHAIPNGGSRGGDAKSRAIEGGKMKAEGVKRGILDIFLPLPMTRYATGGLMNPAETVMRYAGLYIELKRPKTEKAGVRKATITDQQAGALSDEQSEFVAYARAVGYAVTVCFDWRSAARDIQSYIEAVRNNA